MSFPPVPKRGAGTRLSLSPLSSFPRAPTATATAGSITEHCLDSDSTHFVVCVLRIDTIRRAESSATMGNSSSTPSSAPVAKDDGKECKSSQKVGIKSGKKICCCCPETKQARDACILANGEEDKECQRLIELHKECLRSEGFDVK